MLTFFGEERRGLAVNVVCQIIVMHGEFDIFCPRESFEGGIQNLNNLNFVTSS